MLRVQDFRTTPTAHNNWVLLPESLQTGNGFQPEIWLPILHNEPLPDTVINAGEDAFKCIKNFEELNLGSHANQILEIVQHLGFDHPTRVQGALLEMTVNMPCVNVLVQAPPSSGKTVGLVLATITHINPHLQFPQVLFVVPGFEVVLEVKDWFRNACFNSSIRYRFDNKGFKVIPGVKLDEHVLIASPRKLLSWISMKAFSIERVSKIIFDEADFLITSAAHSRSLCRLYEISPRITSIWVSSTFTFGTVEKTKEIVRSGVEITMKRSQIAQNNIKHVYVECKDRSQMTATLKGILLLVNDLQVLIFCQGDAATGSLAKQLSEDTPVRAIYTSQHQFDRFHELKLFKTKQTRVLLTCTVMSRGVDIKDLKVVINYGMPLTLGGELDQLTYLHRSGRCGRFGRPGVTINIITKADLPAVRKLESFTVKKFIPVKAGKGCLNVIRKIMEGTTVAESQISSDAVTATSVNIQP